MFSIERKVLTAVVLTASLVAMAVGQQPAPSRASKQRPPVSAGPAAAAQLPSRTQTAPPVSATPAAAAQLPSRAHTVPQAAPTPAALPDAHEPSTPGAALAPAAVASEPSTVLTPTAARTSPAQAAPSASSRVRPTLAPAAAADWQALPFQTPRASTAPPAAALAPPARFDTLEPPQLSTSRSPQNHPRPAVAQTPQASTPRSPDYVEEKGFKGRVFEIKHRDPDSLAQVLRPLGSGFKGATISANREFKILTVRDFPENIAAMDEAIKRLDTPEARSPDIEFTVHIIIASSDGGSGGDVPSDLGPVLKQLQSTLRYKTYNLMTSAIHRGKEGPVKVENSGIAESKLLGATTPQGNPIFFNYALQRISLDGSAASATIQVGDFNFRMRSPVLIGSGGQIQYENIGFNTPVSVREGEKVVVGTTSMGDKGLIVVLSARVVK